MAGTSRKRPWSLIWAAVGSLAAAAAVLWGVLTFTIDDDDDSGDNASNQVNVHGNNNVVTNENYQDFTDEVGTNPTPEAVERAAAEFENVKPEGDPPWPFYVVVGDIGLQVRNSGEVDGRQIGSAGNNTTLWVMCRMHTDFDPPARRDVGSSWLKVRWPVNTPEVSTFFNSSPTDPFTGYVYEGYLFPAGHNGAVPNC
jgi:hypothetical protein